MKTYTPIEGTVEDLQRRFTYHAPHGDQADRYTQIRKLGLEAASAITLLCPSSRELSLALTRLEEMVFWANAAIARNEKPPAASAGPAPLRENLPPAS